MTAKEKAKAGVWLLKQAVLDFVADHPGATSRDVIDGLGLASAREKGDRDDKLLWGIDSLLIAEARMTMSTVNNRCRRYVAQ